MSNPNSKTWEPAFVTEWRRMAAPEPVPTEDPGRHPLQHVWPSLTKQSIWWRWFLWVQRLSFYMDNSRVGRLWDLFDTVLNMVQVALFIWHTTAVGTEKAPIPLGLGHRIPELGLALVLLGQFVVRHVFIMGEHFSFFMLVTFLDTIPSILATCLSFANQGIYQSYLSAGVLAIFYPIRFVRLQLSLARLFSPGHNSLLKMSQVKRKLLLLASDVALTLLAVAAVLHAWLHHFSRDRLEESQREFNYFDAFFFCSVSLIAGPENDVVPDLLITRLVVLLILLLAAVFLPAPIGEILGLMRGVSHYTSYTADPRTNHVIVCGNLEFTAINEFLNEFYNEDHGIRIMHTSVVIVHPNEPSEELASLLADPRYAHRVSYYRGSPTSYSVLEKLEARKAKAVFILTAKFGRRARIDDDAETVMYALAISSYICGPVVPLNSDMWNPNIVFTWPARLFPLDVASGQTRIYAQTLLPETETHFRILKNTRILAVEEFRMGLLAQSCATEGFSTLMHLLTTTLTDKTVQRLLTALTPQVSSHELSWMTTYLQGATQEIYETRFPQAFVGLPYRSVVRLLYQKFRVVLFAVGISRRRPRHLHQGESEFHEVYLNPVNHTIRPNDLAFLVASSSEQVDRITDYPSLMGSSLSLVSFHNPSYSGLHSESQRQPLEDGLDMMEEKYESEEFPIPRRTSQDLPPSAPIESNPSPLAHEVRPSSVLKAKFRPPVPTNIPISPLLASQFVGKVEAPVVTPQTNTLTYSPTFEIRKKVASKVHKFSTKDLARNVRRRKRKVLQQQDPFPRDLRNHILICDASPMFPRNVEYLVQSLKTAFNDEHLPIIILAASHPPKVQALTLQDFHDVYVVEGSPLSAADLSRTYVERARGVIVLSNAKYYSNTSKRLADSTAVLFEMNMRSFRNHPLCFPVVEVLHRENIKFIDGETPLRSEEQYASQLLRPSFMSGRVFIPTMLDVMLCHSYFNPHILEVYKHLIFSHDQFTTPKSTMYGDDGLVARTDEFQRVSPLGLVPVDASDGTQENRRPQGHTVGNPQYEGSISPSESPCSSSSGPTSGEASHSHSRDHSPVNQEPLDFGPPPPPPSSTLSSSRPPDSSTLKSEPDTGILRPSLYAGQYGASEQGSGRRIFTDGESDILAGPAPPTVVKAMPPPMRLKKRIRRGQVFLIPLPRAYLANHSNYESLFLDLLLNHDAVTLGLYRSVRRANGLSSMCVLVNPTPDTPLQWSDRAYIICQSRPMWAMTTTPSVNPSRRGSAQHDAKLPRISEAEERTTGIAGPSSPLNQPSPGHNRGEPHYPAGRLSTQRPGGYMVRPPPESEEHSVASSLSTYYLGIAPPSRGTPSLSRNSRENTRVSPDRYPSATLPYPRALTAQNTRLTQRRNSLAEYLVRPPLFDSSSPSKVAHPGNVVTLPPSQSGNTGKPITSISAPTSRRKPKPMLSSGGDPLSVPPVDFVRPQGRAADDTREDRDDEGIPPLSLWD